MDLEVLGRHALLFDDDDMAVFVNSGDALVEWNSLLIDRYDVRHLLSAPPPPRRRFHSSANVADSSIMSQLDYERYLDLPLPSDNPVLEEGEKSVDADAYRAAGLSYGNADDSADRISSEVGLESSKFRPSFPVPESLIHCLMLGAEMEFLSTKGQCRHIFVGLECLKFPIAFKSCEFDISNGVCISIGAFYLFLQPPTEKVHQIISRTALFVSKHGGQSEIVLRVKQGNNPTFGFLMPDHNLHEYFRFIVDHPEFLQSDSDLKAQNEEKKSSTENREYDGVGGALSLLGSVYESGEDEEPVNDDVHGSKVPIEEACDPVERAESSSKACKRGEKDKDEKVSAHSLRFSKDKDRASALKKNYLVKASMNGIRSGVWKEGAFGSSAASTKTKVEVSKTGPLVEPPSDLKILIDKIVEFILKNGKQFASTLMEQDSKHGRFPFLLPSNQYHPYYLKQLQRAQESKVHGPDNRASSPSVRADLPYAFEKKEKFKMVIGKSKESLDFLTKTSQQEDGVNVDAAAAAAILQAATRGIKNPNLSIMSSSSSKNGAELASEADSSNARVSKEQKLKAERLRRAKMFVAQLKGGTASVKRDFSHGGSVEPQESALSGSSTEVNFRAAKERESSAALSDLNTVEREGSFTPLGKSYVLDETSEVKQNAEEHEPRSRRKYRSKSGRHEEEEEEEDKEERQQRSKKKRHHSSRDEEEESEEARDARRSKKKRRSRHHDTHDDSDDTDEDKDKKRLKRKHHRRRHEYDDDEHKRGREKHSRHRSPHENRKDERSKKNHTSRRTSHRSKHSSSDDESGRVSKHVNSSNDKDQHSEKCVKPPEEIEEPEEGEIRSKVSDQSREASMDVSTSRDRAPSQPSESTDIPDDLRAKIRQMLISTRK